MSWIARAPYKPESPRRRAGATRPIFIMLAAILLVLPLQAQGNPHTETRLTHSCASLHELGVKLLEGFNQSNRAKIESLRITKDEFKNVIWPQLPRSRPECNFPWEYAWNDLNHKSTYHLREKLACFGGKRYTLVKIRFAGKTSDYKTYKVYRDSRVLVQDETGVEKELKIFGSVVELDKKYKIMSFVTD